MVSKKEVNFPVRLKKDPSIPVEDDITMRTINGNSNGNEKANASGAGDIHEQQYGWNKSTGTRHRRSMARMIDEKNVGLGAGAIVMSQTSGSIEFQETKVRRQEDTFLLTRLFTTLWAAALVFVVYLITLETLMSCALSLGLTIFWYKKGDADTWAGSGMDWIVLGFAVITPITVTIQMAFTRRERALYEISRIRSCCFQIYSCHNIWNWSGGKGRENAMTKEQWLKHTDELLEHLVGIGDEMCRFLTLPTSSRSYHRMLKGGRRKASNIVEVGYRLLDSMYTQRIIKISQLTEKFKSLGLSATESSRIRQYERFIGEAIEILRTIKMYRTPQALRCFGRVFTLFLPSFYAPAFAQVALDLDSLTMGILSAILTPLLLTALFESMQMLEDPFVGWVSLDGIDVAEEMEVLHFHQLINARSIFFPDADVFEEKSKAAIVSATHLQLNNSHDAADATPSSMDGSSRQSHYATDEMSSSYRPRRTRHYTNDEMSSSYRPRRSHNESPQL
eukprot:CAMPEP_0204623366 /NCGR_PEP_ID=MMETSP0717-20131115/9096_1 /ASSEMBLY_ACC=CAM_ASM_000666 /TAXON_ID=230516 /ORGANISM="Chaetoceros curvisetus" /LENGTH=505 /DNA_ID=CAMNT_0051638423 /DNA_START=102 /DNA_END=1619 /DNA_ORIENTATION=-